MTNIPLLCVVRQVTLSLNLYSAILGKGNKLAWVLAHVSQVIFKHEDEYLSKHDSEVFQHIIAQLLYSLVVLLYFLSLIHI